MFNACGYTKVLPFVDQILTGIVLVCQPQKRFADFPEM